MRFFRCTSLLFPLFCITQTRNPVSDASASDEELKKLLWTLNRMKDNDRESLINRIEIAGIENSLTNFLENAWERGVKFKFESSHLPVHVLCRDSERNTFHRRSGAVLEATVDGKNHGMKSRRWVAVFYLDNKTGYYLENLKDQRIIQRESGKNNGETPGEIIVDSVYECPRYPDSDIERHNKRENEREDQIIRNIENRWEEDGGEF